MVPKQQQLQLKNNKNQSKMGRKMGKEKQPELLEESTGETEDRSPREMVPPPWSREQRGGFASPGAMNGACGAWIRTIMTLHRITVGGFEQLACCFQPAVPTGRSPGGCGPGALGAPQVLTQNRLALRASRVWEGRQEGAAGEAKLSTHP